MANQQILVADDDHKERTVLSKSLEDWGYHVATASDGYVALRKIKAAAFDLVIADFEIPGLDGQSLFDQARTEKDTLQFLFLSRKASVEHAVEMMKAGALDFMIKPVDLTQLRLVVQSAFEVNGAQRCPPAAPKKTTRIVSCDSGMQGVLALAEQIADSKASVLIQGESGTGKELFARFIHEHSSRRDNAFVAVNCGALPETLLESELFGHEKGAFTGAVSRKPGRFELADGGTLLLDEITEMAFHLQSKLLRVLQQGEIDRVGGLRPVPVDVRIIATTNRNLREAVEKATFREDLFYRLNVIPLTLPPLRQRKSDIPLLAAHFIDKYNQIDGRRVKSMTKEASDALCRFPFPGNVRELENIIERAVLLSGGQQIEKKDLLLEDGLAPAQTYSGSSDDGGGSPEISPGPLREVEKKLIFQTLDQTNGNRTHAAGILGISVRTLRNKLNEYRGEMDAL